MIVVSMRNLDWRERVGVFWSFLWRALTAAAGTVIVAGTFGIFSGTVVNIAGAMMGMNKYAVDMPMQIIGGLTGALVGVLSLYILLRWLLRTKLGQYRLVLVDANEAP